VLEPVDAGERVVFVRLGVGSLEWQSANVARAQRDAVPRGQRQRPENLTLSRRRPTHKYTAEIDCRSVMAVLEVAQQHPGLGVGCSRAASCAWFSGRAEPLATRCRGGRQGQRQHLRLGTDQMDRLRAGVRLNGAQSTEAATSPHASALRKRSTANPQSTDRTATKSKASSHGAGRIQPTTSAAIAPIASTMPSGR
jgi:hypothetical protein